MRISNRKERRAAASTARTATSRDWGPWECRTFSRAELEGTIAEFMSCAYVNAVYSVQQYECDVPAVGVVLHLAIRRHDSAMTRSWSDLQRIKNELAGKERVAFEVFPKTTDLVDEANMQHLWVMPDGYDLPFGLHRFAWGRARAFRSGNKR